MAFVQIYKNGSSTSKTAPKNLKKIWAQYHTAKKHIDHNMDPE